MFGLIKFVFWVFAIGCLLYFSGDIKFRDKSLKVWVAELSGSVEKEGIDADLLKLVNRLLNQEKDGLSDEELKEVKRLINEQLSKRDQTDLNTLMKTLTQVESGEKKPAQPHVETQQVASSKPLVEKKSETQKTETKPSDGKKSKQPNKTSEKKSDLDLSQFKGSGD